MFQIRSAASGGSWPKAHNLGISSAHAPTLDSQIEFLVKLQRLLDEGLFVASYKFALLLALADLSIEAGDDSGRPLPITTEQIAGKFIQYYWRQAAPYVAPAEAKVL
jgi:hypothetical protein